MPTNIEIKARLRDPEEAMRIAEEIAGNPPEIIEQDDVFYTAPRGRIKLRTLAPDQGELIYYNRPDQPGPSTCEYIIAPTSNPAALDEILCQTLGARGRIRKTRRLYRAGRTRIHLDEVEHLGHFLEIEVVLKENEPHEDGQAEAQALMQQFGIEATDLIEFAYIDLIASAFSEE